MHKGRDSMLLNDEVRSVSVWKMEVRQSLLDPVKFTCKQSCSREDGTNETKWTIKKLQSTSQIQKQLHACVLYMSRVMI